ncbi:MAG: DUF4190 domain-containing protein [Clostridium sp.]|jgi:hypothetical protein|nr:DUF4190 domain-containing protein [Clostridium sp.]
MDHSNHSDKDLWTYRDSSKSPYYNQPTFDPHKKDAFSIASLVLGILALLFACTVFLPIPLGSLGILFAVLSFRRKRPFPPFALAGSLLSGIALALSAALIVSSLAMLPKMLQEEAYRRQLDLLSEQLYGQDFETMLEKVYDFDIGQYLEEPE